jgi:hypothetical protein
MRQLDELLHLSKGTKHAPAHNFWELIANVATFMLLPWVLFGTICDYYHSLRKIYTTLELKEAKDLKTKFTPENCCHLTWAILDDGRAYFNNVKTMLNFQGAKHVVFSQLYLINIM